MKCVSEAALLIVARALGDDPLEFPVGIVDAALRDPARVCVVRGTTPGFVRFEVQEPEPTGEPPTPSQEDVLSHLCGQAKHAAREASRERRIRILAGLRRGSCDETLRAAAERLGISLADAQMERVRKAWIEAFEEALGRA